MFAIYVTRPNLMEAEPHSHEFDTYVIFYGGPDNMEDPGAEIEFSFGEEQEKYIITKPTAI
jgi:hypothetical protein